MFGTRLDLAPGGGGRAVQKSKAIRQLDKESATRSRPTNSHFVFVETLESRCGISLLCLTRRNNRGIVAVRILFDSFARDTYLLAEPGCRHPFSSSLVAQGRTYWHVQAIIILQHVSTPLLHKYPNPQLVFGASWCFTALLHKQRHESWFIYRIFWHTSASDVTTLEVLICRVFVAKLSNA